MLQALTEIVPIAVGLALVNPLPVMAVILLLFSPRAGAVAWAFVGGWLMGLVLMMAMLVFVVPAERLVGTEQDPTELVSIIRVALGAALLVLAYRKWNARPRDGEKAKLPGWVTSLQNSSPRTAMGIGLAMGAVNPKNLIFAISAAVAIAETQAPAPTMLALIAAYVLIGSVGVLGPVIWRTVAQASATIALQEWRVWLERNYNVMMGVIFVFFGIMVASKGIQGFLH
ncbi:MAG: GAP family protein [Thermomicrobiales bacterium]